MKLLENEYCEIYKWFLGWLRGEDGVVGQCWGACNSGPAHGARCGEADWDDCEGREHGANAQEELQAIRAALEADRELAGAAQDLGAQEVPGDAGASGAARGRAEKVLHSGQ